MSGMSVMLGLAARPLPAPAGPPSRWRRRHGRCGGGCARPSRVRCSLALLGRVERHAQLGQPGDRRRRLAHHMLDHREVVEPAPAIIVSRTWASKLSPSSSTAAIPPCAQPVAPSSERALGDHPDLARLGEVERRGQPAAPEPTTRTSKSRALKPPASPRQAQEDVLQVRVAGRHVDDPEPFLLQRVEHLAGVHLVLAVGDLERPLAGHVDLSKQAASGAALRSRSTSTTTALSCALAISSRVGSLAISLPWLMIAMRSHSCSASSR